MAEELNLELNEEVDTATEEALEECCDAAVEECCEEECVEKSNSLRNRILLITGIALGLAIAATVIAIFASRKKD